jgi:methane/ammonia monooxygenase subunit B
MHQLRRLLTVPAVALLVTIFGPVTPASAHGETAQESFLRMGTVAFWDVTFSETSIAQNETFTITGTAKILETWPEQLAAPELGFISVLAPGPVVVTKERTVNGAPEPNAIEIHKGGVYNFEMTLAGREPGHWHVHPIFGVHGAGSLIGPGQYIDVKAAPGGFTNNVMLSANGTTQDIESIGVGGLWFWSIVWFIVGMAWLLYWIWPKPTVTRLPVTSQIPLNTDGMSVGLITRRDHRAMNVIMLVTLLLLAGGWIYQANAYPNKITQQVLRFEPPAAEMDEQFVDAKITKADYDEPNHTVTLTVDAENTGKSDATLQAFTTANLTFPTEGVADAVDGHSLRVSGSPKVAAGDTESLTITMADQVWGTEKLMATGESRTQISGVLRFRNDTGDENFATVVSFVHAKRA